jgi:hypothetical protein
MFKKLESTVMLVMLVVVLVVVLVVMLFPEPEPFVITGRDELTGQSVLSKRFLRSNQFHSSSVAMDLFA